MVLLVLKINKMGRRMFSPHVVSQDLFLDMPVSARELYFQLGMSADDDGFVSPRRIMKMINASEDDLRILIAKGYVILFPSGVVSIAHWLINNLVRKDWYKPTQYLNEKNQLLVQKGSVLRLKSSVNEVVNESVNVINQLTNKLKVEKVEENHFKKEDDEISPEYQKIRSEINQLLKKDGN